MENSVCRSFQHYFVLSLSGCQETSSSYKMMK